MVASMRVSRRERDSTCHKLGCRRALDEALLDQGISEDDFSQFHREIIFVGGAVLRYRRPYADGRDGDVLPQELFGPSEFWSQTKEFAILEF